MTTEETDSSTRAGRIALASGIAFSVVTVIAFVVLGHATSSPKISSSPAKIASFYIAHHGDEQAAAYLLAVTATLLAVFVTSSRPLIRTTRSTWSTLFLGGGLVASASFLFAGAVHLALAAAASHHLAPSALQALNALDINTGLAFTAGVGIMLLGAAATLSTRADALRVIGWIALPLGIVNLTPAGVAVFPLTALWIIATGILLTRRSDASIGESATPALAT